MFNAHVLNRARNPGGCKTLLEFMRRVVKTWTIKRHMGEEENKEEVSGVGADGGAVLEDGRRTPRAPYKSDPESRLDGQMGKHRLERLISTGKCRPARRCRVCTRGDGAVRPKCLL